VTTRERQLLVLFWVVPAVVATLGLEFVGLMYNPELSLLQKLCSQLLMWLAWAAWSMLILAVCDRVPVVKGGVGRAMFVRIALWLFVVSAQIIVVSQVGAFYGLNPARPLVSQLAVGLVDYGDTFTVIFWAVVGAHAAFRWHEAWRAESLVSARLGADLANAKLDALQAQLNPHFLFNSLNSVVALIASDPQSAQRMVVRLGDLLRNTLTLSGEQEVPLRDELELVQRYLDIEQVRFPDRLTIEWDIEERTRPLAVPSLVLQPLVENALVHGIARLPGAGTVTIGARASAASLILTVRDNGPGLSIPPKSRGHGIGLRNLRERLERLYGEAALLQIVDVTGGGCLVTLALPLRAHPGVAK
jgi:signal transduction histidine kinase